MIVLFAFAVYGCFVCLLPCMNILSLSCMVVLFVFVMYDFVCICHV